MFSYSYIPKETWDWKEEYWESNSGYGMCNTNSGYRIICSLGGIGCNVDHAFIQVRNLKNAFIESEYNKKISGS